MRIELEKSEGKWRADCKDLPGTPPVGIGRTQEEAVAMLFAKLLIEPAKSNGGWIGMLQRSLARDLRVIVEEKH